MYGRPNWIRHVQEKGTISCHLILLALPLQLVWSVLDFTVQFSSYPILINAMLMASNSISKGALVARILALEYCRLVCSRDSPLRSPLIRVKTQIKAFNKCHQICTGACSSPGAGNMMS